MAAWSSLANWSAWAAWPLTQADPDGTTWGDLTSWSWEVWTSPTGYPDGGTVADLSPVELAAPTITPLSRIPSSMRPLERVRSSMRSLPVGTVASVGPASVAASGLTVAPESLAPGSRVVAITSVSPAVSGFTVLLTAAELPTVGIPVFAGAETPDHPGPYLWIVDADTIYYEDGT